MADSPAEAPSATADPRLRILLVALKSAEAFLGERQTAQVRVAVELPQEIAALALIRARSLLRSVLLLLEAGEAFGAESVIRTLLELALNVAWVGLDADRAVRYRDNGLRRAEEWLQALRQYGMAFSAGAEEWLRKFLAQKSARHPAYPNPFKRAEQVAITGKRFKIVGMPRAYMAYQRLSGATHADFWHIAAFADAEKAALVLDAQDATAAASFVIMVGSEILGWSDEAAEVIEGLRRAAAETLGARVG